MITRKQLNRIFYIYSNASVAVFTAVAAVIEIICGLVLQFAFDNPVYMLCYPAAVCFTAMTIGLVTDVYADAKRSNII